MCARPQHRRVFRLDLGGLGTDTGGLTRGIALSRIIWTGYALSALIAVIVTILLLSPMPEGRPPRVPHLDKLVHAGLFAAVALPALLVAARRRHMLVWLLVFGYSGITELVQPYFGRGAELGDLAANAFGAGFAVLLARLWQSESAKVKQRQRTKIDNRVGDRQR